MGAHHLPPVLLSHKALVDAGVVSAPAQLPITQEATTYCMTQELSWLDANHFAIGRWDGSMSVYRFQTADAGPVMTAVVNSPAEEGVQMLTMVAPKLLVSSNDAQSLILWSSPTGAWNDLSAVQRLTYSPSYGVANSGASFASADGTTLYLAVGHENGYLSIWSGTPAGFDLSFVTAIDLSSTKPVNPWNLHNIRGVAYVTQDSGGSYVVTGSEDGNLTVVQVPSGNIMSAVVFNPEAQRGINSIAYSAQGLLVANCAVGEADKNLWFYSIDASTWAITLIASTNLVVDPTAAQVFNFDVIWGTTSGSPCWFASTAEGYLWMGTASSSGIAVTGNQKVTSPLGGAIGITPSGLLAFAAYDLYQFVTG